MSVNTTLPSNVTNNTVPVTNTLLGLSLFNDAISYGTVASCLASFLATGGSIGGGGMQVCIFLLFFTFNASSATTLSRTVVFSVVLVTYFYAWRTKHPHVRRPLIDYDIALLMGPTSILGSTYGTMINVVFSDYVIFICMIVVLLFSVYKTLEKAFKIRKREQEAKLVSESGIDEKAQRPKASDTTISLDSSCVNSTNETQKRTDPRDEEIQQLQDMEARQFPLDRYFLVLMAITGIALSSIFAGGKTVSVIGVVCGSWAYYFVIFGCTIPYLTGISAYTAWDVYRKEKRKEQLGYPYHPSEMKWTVTKLLIFPTMAFIVGLCAGAFGIGGGLIQGPLMLALGVAPGVMSVTSQFVVLMNTTATLIQYFSTGALPWDWALWFIGFGMWGAFFGRGLLESIVKSYKKQSIIVFFLAILIVITTGALVYSFSRRITSNTATWSFKALCQENTTITNTTNTTIVNTTHLFGPVS